MEKKQIKDLEIRGKFFIRFFPEKSKPDNVFFSTRFSTIPTKNPPLTFKHLDCKSPFQQAIINTKVYLKLKKEKIFMVGWDGVFGKWVSLLKIITKFCFKFFAYFSVIKTILMDTGDLSNETYRAILSEAESFNHDLTLQFGVLSGSCKNEEEFIEKSIELIEEMKSYNECDLMDMFFGNPPEKKEFLKVLETILDNIEEVKKIPPHKRTYFYE